MSTDTKKRDRPGWPTEPDGSFVIPAGEANWRKFVELATEEQMLQALSVLEAMPDPKRGAH